MPSFLHTCQSIFHNLSVKVCSIIYSWGELFFEQEHVTFKMESQIITIMQVFVCLFVCLFFRKCIKGERERGKKRLISKNDILYWQIQHNSSSTLLFLVWSHFKTLMRYNNFHNLRYMNSRLNYQQWKARLKIFLTCLTIWNSS